MPHPAATRARSPSDRSRPSTGPVSGWICGAPCSPSAAARATRTPLGIATLAVRQTAGGSVRAAAWGPGATWALEQVPALCGAHDDATGFDASRHPLVEESHRRNGDLRLSRTDLVFDALAG